MTDREKIINGLECCSKGDCADCDNCTYHGVQTDVPCESTLMKEALTLLKAQEPRVLTAEQIADLKYHDIVYVEFKHPTKEKYRTMGGFVDQIYKDTDTHEIKAIDITLGINEIAHCSMKLYLNDFRLWTSRPTDEQMEAMKWE